MSTLSVTFLTEFIEMYRSLPALWKVKSSDYSNRSLRKSGYQKLVNFCKTVVPGANKEYVIKKISNLRGAFRKELKKVKASKHSGMDAEEPYTPKLWYFNLLMFTAEQESIRESTDNDTDDTESEVANLDSQDETQSTSAGQSDILVEEVEERELETEPTNKRPKTIKNSKKNIIAENSEIYRKALKTLSKEEDEYDHLGATIAAKLRKMEETQRIYCENIINTACYKGLLGKLNENTRLYEEVPTVHYSSQYTSEPSRQFVPIHHFQRESGGSFRINDFLNLESDQ